MLQLIKLTEDDGGEDRRADDGGTNKRNRDLLPVHMQRSWKDAVEPIP